MDWFRSWHGAPTDTKFLVIAKRASVAPGMVSAVYWALLDHASQNTPRGSVAGFDVEAYATWAGWDERDVIAIIAAFGVKGTIVDDTITAWDKRQPKREDDSRQRVAAFRERERALQDDVTQCNAYVTQGNAPDKIQIQIREDTDTATAGVAAGAVAGAIKAWHSAGQTATGFLVQQIEAAVDDWCEVGHADYVERAIVEAAKNGKLSWKYVEGILKRCRVDGTAPDAKRPGGKTNGHRLADDFGLRRDPNEPEWDKGIPAEWKGREWEYLESITLPNPPA